MLKWLLPKEVGFFHYFQRISALTSEACNELLHMANNENEIAARARRIRQLEHDADDVTRECIDALHKTFITPFDRGDIHRLTKRLDDILDAVHQAALRIEMYEIGRLRPEVGDLAQILMEGSKQIGAALALLHDTKNAPKIDKHCKQVYTMEAQADVIVRRAIATMYKEEEARPVLAMQWREIYDALEKAANRCEDVANVIEGILIEAS